MNGAETMPTEMMVQALRDGGVLSAREIVKATGLTSKQVLTALTSGLSRERFIKHPSIPPTYSVNPEWKSRRSGRVGLIMTGEEKMNLWLGDDGRLRIFERMLTSQQTQELGDFLIRRKDDWG